VRDEETVFATAASLLVPYDLDAARPRRVSPEVRAFLEQYLETPPA
jgi:acyl-CoA thioester hydrolase